MPTQDHLYAADLDFHADADSDIMATITSWPSLAFQLIDPEGPGGGAPVYRVIGAYDDLYAFVFDYGFLAEDMDDVILPLDEVRWHRP